MRYSHKLRMPPNKILIYKGKKGKFMWRNFIKLTSNGTQGTGATEQMRSRALWPNMHNLNRIMRKYQNPHQGTVFKITGLEYS